MMRKSFGEWSLEEEEVKEEMVVEELEGEEVWGRRVEATEDVEEKRWGFDPLE